MIHTCMKARNQNADPNYHLKMNAEEIYNEIKDTILSIAKAERKKAENKIKTLESIISFYLYETGEINQTIQ